MALKPATKIADTKTAGTAAPSAGKAGSARGAGNPCVACPVRGIALCAPLQGKELDRLNCIVTHARFSPEGAAFYEGDEAEHIFNVTSGCVRLSKMLPDGRRQITGFLWPGDFFGLAFDRSYSYTAEAVGEVEVCRFPRAKLEALFREYPKLEHRLLSMAGNELIAAQDHMMVLGRKTAQERIATFLILLSRRSVRAGQGENSLDLPMNRADIADHLGLTVETVSRTFTQLRKNKIIDLPDPRSVAILDRARLEGASDGH